MKHFEYDPSKSKVNKERHGVDLVEAQELWASIHVIIPAKNVLGENRRAIVGKLKERVYVAIFTQRGEIIRLISCHMADRRWQKVYEEHTKQENG